MIASTANPTTIGWLETNLITHRGPLTRVDRLCGNHSSSSHGRGTCREARATIKRYSLKCQGASIVATRHDRSRALRLLLDARCADRRCCRLGVQFDANRDLVLHADAQVGWF